MLIKLILCLFLLANSSLFALNIVDDILKKIQNSKMTDKDLINIFATIPPADFAAQSALFFSICVMSRCPAAFDYLLSEKKPTIKELARSRDWIAINNVRFKNTGQSDQLILNNQIEDQLNSYPASCLRWSPLRAAWVGAVYRGRKAYEVKPPVADVRPAANRRARKSKKT